MDRGPFRCRHCSTETDRGPVILSITMSALPLIDAEPPERADAARNRRAVLDAAARLFARDGANCVTMEAVAAEAGGGKGRGFPRLRRRGEPRARGDLRLRDRPAGAHDPRRAAARPRGARAR